MDIEFDIENKSVYLSFTYSKFINSLKIVVESPLFVKNSRVVRFHRNLTLAKILIPFKY